MVRIFRKIVVSLIIYTIVELAVLFFAIHFIGIGYTVLLLLISVFLGCSMVWHEGLPLLRDIQSDLNARRIPGDALLNGLCLIFGGVLFVIPGFITDFAGLLFFIPGFRRRMIKRMQIWLRNRLNRGSFSFISFRQR